MQPEVITELVKNLLDDVNLQQSGTNASKLWRAALQLLPETGRAAMDYVQQKMPAKRRSGWHLAVLTRLFDRESDLYVDRLLGGNSHFYLAEELIKKYAGMDEMHVDRVYAEWAISGWALRTAIDHLKITFDPPGRVSLF